MASKTNKASSAADNDLLKKMEEIKKGGPFLMAVSIFDQKKKPKERLSAFLLTNSFPLREIGRAQKMIAKMINDLKKNKI